MSIIYDALTKTQKNIKGQHNKTGNKYILLARERNQKFDWLDVTLIMAIIFLSVVISQIYFTKHKQKPSIAKSAVNQVAVSQSIPVVPSMPKEMMYQGPLQLNGIFISDDEKLAFIDHNERHVGDMVEGKRIISIDYSQVKLQEGNNIFVMKAQG